MIVCGLFKLKRIYARFLLILFYLLTSVLLLDIQFYWGGRVGIPLLTGLTPWHCYACSKDRTEFPMPYSVGICCFWRGCWSMVWCGVWLFVLLVLWNCWPSLFKPSFNSYFSYYDLSYFMSLLTFDPRITKNSEQIFSSVNQDAFTGRANQSELRTNMYLSRLIMSNWKRKLIYCLFSIILPGRENVIKTLPWNNCFSLESIFTSCKSFGLNFI